MSTTETAYASTARPFPDQAAATSSLSIAPPAPHQDLHEVTEDELRNSLSVLGHNHRGELVYTRCDLASKRLCAVPGLQRYRHLQWLHIDDNGLTELEAVRHMPQLVYLHACRNRLTADIFTVLADSAAGCLERLSLDDNCIASLDGLEKLPFLIDFNCSGNRVRALPARALSAAQRLMHFALRDNALEVIDAHAFSAARQLRILELDGNALTNVDFLHGVTPEVENVTLASNRITKLSSALEQLACLAMLDVGKNRIVGLHELQVLRSLRALRTLTFSGNDALEHLPSHLRTVDAAGLQAAPAAPLQHTEFHAEVVMSDEESEMEKALRLADGKTANEGNPIPFYATSTADKVPDGDDERRENVLSNPLSETAASIGSYKTDASTSAASRNTTSPASRLFATGPAVPTTAAYAILAASETHGFVHAVGRARRDAKLQMRVDHKKEIEALPEWDQVYLWTLSVLPQLTELNGRTIHPEEVAKAAFLFCGEAV